MKTQKQPISSKKGRNFKDKRFTVGITHVHADLDGRSAKEILSSYIRIDKMIFWGGERLEFPPETSQAIFLDCFPDCNLEAYLQKRRIRTIIVDHHPHERCPNETTVSLLAKRFKGRLRIPEEKINKFVEWSKRADFGTKDGRYANSDHNMNIASLIRTMNFFNTDPEVQEWTQVVVRSELMVGKADFEQGRRFFIGFLETFLREYKRLTSGHIIRRFINKAKKPDVLEDSMNIVPVTAKALVMLGEGKTKKWLSMVVFSIERKQQAFQVAYRKIKEAAEGSTEHSITIATTGNFVVIIGVLDDIEFGPAARRYAKSNYSNKTLVVVKILLENKGFQISGGKKDDLGELVKALRVLILEQQRKEISINSVLLGQGGTVSGTDPLYYHKAGYPRMMWGSLTRPDVRKVDIPVEILIETIMKVLDLEFFTEECKKSEECLKEKCSLYKFRLQRCYQRNHQRYQNRNSKIRSFNNNKTREEMLIEGFKRNQGSAVTIKIEK